MVCFCTAAVKSVPCSPGPPFFPLQLSLSPTWPQILGWSFWKHPQGSHGEQWGQRTVKPESMVERRYLSIWGCTYRMVTLEVQVMNQILSLPSWKWVRQVISKPVVWAWWGWEQGITYCPVHLWEAGRSEGQVHSQVCSWWLMKYECIVTAKALRLSRPLPCSRGLKDTISYR